MLFSSEKRQELNRLNSSIATFPIWAMGHPMRANCYDGKIAWNCGRRRTSILGTRCTGRPFGWVFFYRQRKPDGTVVEAYGLTNFPSSRVGVASLFHMAKSRWEIENEGFNEAKSRHGLEHIWLVRGPLRREWFFEQANGNCRLMGSFAGELAETAKVWRKASRHMQKRQLEFSGKVDVRAPVLYRPG